MTLTPEQELENAIIKKNYHTICDLFGLSQPERMHLNAGEWIVDSIKQYQTSFTIVKSMRMRSNETQKVETYQASSPLPPKPTVLEELTTMLTRDKESPESSS